MFGYYLQLALRSLRRSPVLSALMVLSIAVGIGAAMTTLTVMRLLSGDPLPGRSQRIFYPQLDPRPAGSTGRQPFDKLDYPSAMDLWKTGRADRQAVVAESQIKLRAPERDGPAFMAQMLSTQADFFPMFQVPFAYGSGWRARDDQDHARVAVISADLNNKLFEGRNSVGRSLLLRGNAVRIVGVLAPWRPSPQFYTLAGGSFSHGDTGSFYGKPQDVFAPLSTSLEINDGHIEPWTCFGTPAQPLDLRIAPCVWVQLWVQLDTPAKVADYRRLLADYAAQQQAAGRIGRTDTARLLSLPQWLDHNRVVPGDVRLQSWLAVAFLGLCLFNSVGLLLAKFLRRGGEIGVRRALGASRRAIFAQCLTEASVIGLIGGIGGWLLTLLGLWSVRQQPAAYADLARLDLLAFAGTFVLAVGCSVAAGLFPALRASRIAPALQLKTL
ncbi:ABC transporter ATP-binding protein [Xanthomonas sp. GW]|uniref:ABC transporter permease n=1 Tax=Xanthomonas sp. GW TaxID=2724121 RepID=UPI001639C214|nr:ABC transporter permease [Xanthomonas sp. GW]QNH22774.1 ABC transporter ATP-binding protein [Xanthomonas sp. GW]